MNKWQKQARFTLIVTGLALVLSLTTVEILRFVFDFNWHRATAGFAFMALMALSRVDPTMFRIKSKKPPLDERDLLIKRKAMVTAYWGFWPIFVLMAMAPFYVYGPDGKVPVTYLCWMVFVGMFVVMTLYSIAILNEYGWSDKGEKS
ncbi:MAG: hypothetical protein GY845_10670 [Planctomycetes bacterium]|nr:hypothetical protein [Planctomycetota bacterium]